MGDPGTEIAQRQRLEAQVRESEERWRLLLHGVRDYAICMLDPEGRVLSWSAGAQEIKGYSAEDILGKHFFCFYPPEDVAQGKPARNLRRAAQEGCSEEEGWFGIGLIGMREHIQQLGGEFQIRTHSGGTTVTVRMPVVPVEAALGRAEPR